MLCQSEAEGISIVADGMATSYYVNKMWQMEYHYGRWYEHLVMLTSVADGIPLVHMFWTPCFVDWCCVHTVAFN